MAAAYHGSQRHGARCTFALLVAVLTVSSACTRPREGVAVPAPASPAAGPAEAAPRSVESVHVPDPGSGVACATSGRVALDADSVALRFTAAFLKAGILPIRLSLPSVDGVSAGPVDVAVPVAARISARAATEVRNDSTAYRVEVRVGPTRQGWAAGDSAVATAHASGICRQVVEAALP